MWLGEVIRTNPNVLPLRIKMVVVLYMPLSVFGYTVYGASLDSSVIYSIQTSALQLGANLMIAVHCIMTLVIVINPLNQEVEHYLKLIQVVIIEFIGFGTGRVLTRTTVLLIVLFVGLTVPDFSPVMNLVGASTIPVGCVVLPSLFYLWSQAATEDEWRKGHIPSIADVVRRTDKTVLIMNMFILTVAIVGGVLGTMQGLEKLAKAEFSAPCYIRAFTSNIYENKFQVKQIMIWWVSLMLLFSLAICRDLRNPGYSLRDTRAIAPSINSWCIFYPERCRLLSAHEGSDYSAKRFRFF
uniref:Aa_trans domain-containing protein n=1 Tax=Heterorhabditis bacteriophora TaxID=37862 RepID=A0A1I7XEF2_HETBA